MFKKSLLMVLLVFGLVFTSAFASQLWITKDLPSSYDPGTSLDTAFKSAKTPLLIEFYSDGCGSCQKLAPVIHKLSTDRYGKALTLVMLDVTDPANREVAQLFGVDALPALYIFDTHKMKKQIIKPESFMTQGTLEGSLDHALDEIAKAPARNPNARPPMLGGNG